MDRNRANGLNRMSPLDGEQRAEYVRKMFGRIAGHYDLMNRLMTGGLDLRWRKEVIRRAELQPGDTLLDLGAGTGDLTREALHQQPDCRVIAADFTLPMMLQGQKISPLPFAAADALRLPFTDRSFNAVVSGFLMRNVGDVQQALAEQFRVLKPGGRIVILDSTPPQRSILSPFIWVHLHVVIPLLGTLVSGFREAYEYLPDSTEHFITAEALAGLMKSAGFTQVGFHRLMGGTIAIHWGMRPAG